LTSIDPDSEAVMGTQRTATHHTEGTNPGAPELELACCAPVGSPSFDTADAETLARSFAALGDPVRLHVFSLIAAASGGEACACDLVAPVGRSQPTVSHHLKVLREAGLVTSERRGTWVWYRVVPERLTHLRAALA
jgi:ArsR family transcriptional regulator, arsenate/arsenite/antimonite-responsive transcriptional repressor